MNPSLVGASSGQVSIRQLCFWDLLAEATRVPLAAELTVLFDDLDEAIADLPIEQRISVAGEGLAKVGEIVGLRAEIHLPKINQLLHPEQEPLMSLDAFDRYVRQSMVVDLSQFCADPELPEVERGYVRAVVEPMSEEEAIAEIVAAIYDAEPESLLELTHSEDVSGWTAKIRQAMANCGEMRLLELRRRSWGVVEGEDFYEGDGLWVK